MIRRETYNALDAVTDFHKKNGQTVNYTSLGPVTGACAVLRTRLILEELGELAIAIHKNSIVDIADSLADLKYVVIGTAVSFGLPLRDNFPELIKTAPKDLDSLLNEPEKALEILALLSHRVGHVIPKVLESVESIRSGSAEDTESDMQGLLHLMTRLDETISDAADEFGIPLELVFWEVHRSNMTKQLSGKAGDGGKYGDGENPKGKGYRPPDIDSILFPKDEVVQ